MIKVKDTQFYVKNLKRTKKKKGQKLFELPERGFEPQIYSNFPANNLNVTRSNLCEEVKISPL